jgi:hypothetical protein
MNDLTLYNNLKDKDNNIPQILFTTKTFIESEKFRKDLVKIQPLIKSLNYNDVFKIKNGGKNGGKNTKKNLKKKGKTKKNKTYKGGDKNLNGEKYIIMSIIIVAVFSTSSYSVCELFNSFIQYPKSFFDNIIVPFSNVFLNNMSTTVTSSVGYNVVESGVSKILMPTINGFYSTCINALTGNVLAINGLWALYLNSTKLFDYLSSSNTSITDTRIQLALNEVNKSLNNVVNEITQPQQLNLTNINENINENIKTIDIPEGSKLLIPEGSTI